jgi:ADP-heptose:LPS heptosyltransferase
MRTVVTVPSGDGPQPPARFGYAVSRFWRLMPAGMPRRWWLFRLFDLIARHWPVFGRPRGLLVVRMDGIGDMMLFRGALDAHAAAFGIAREDVTVLGCESWGGIGDAAFAGYRLMAIDEHAYARRALYRFAVNLKVRRLNVDVVTCDSYLRRPMMADSLVWASAAPRTVVSLPYVNEPTRATFTWYLSQVDAIVDTGPYPTHEVVRHARFVAAVTGQAAAAAPPAIPWRDMPPDIPPGAPYVVLNPGSNEYGRRWPFARYAALARRLLDEGYRVVVAGSAREAPPEDVWAPLRAEPGVIDRIGRTSLPGLLDLMRHAAGVVSNDTGPAHLALALGAPTVVIVGGGHFGSFVPYPDGVAPPAGRFVFQPMACYHCFWRCDKRASRADSFPCVAAVEEDAVRAALADAMAAAHRPRVAAQ